MPREPYYNKLTDPDYRYKQVDGLQPEINALYGRANAMNKSYNSSDMEKGRDAHVHRPNKMVESNKPLDWK